VGAGQLAYYWFPQRGRILTGEYAVKLWILRDLVARQRSDGGLVRLVTPLRPGEAEQAPQGEDRQAGAEG